MPVIALVMVVKGEGGSVDTHGEAGSSGPPTIVTRRGRDVNPRCGGI